MNDQSSQKNTPPSFSLPTMEEKILAYWKENKVFEKSLEKESPRGNFVFYEGPPTANAKPALHHVEARAFKDLIPRYKTMQGFRVNRKAGWDTHGLPVELQIEKKLGLKNKKDIESYGVAPFNRECKESVWEFKKDWEDLTERIAYWVDMDRPYITYDTKYIESLWWIIKLFWDQGLLYYGHKVVPHCPRCGTALSSHEVAQGYKTVKEPSVYIKFKLKPGQKIGNSKVDDHTYILSWTTTPWTLPGNVALAMGEDIEYTKMKTSKDGGYNFWVGEALANKFLSETKNKKEAYEVYHTGEVVKGKDLVGLEYEPLFDSLKDVPDKKHYIATADFVSTTDGTGVVHIAVMYGEDDYGLGEQLGLPKVHTVNEDGTFNERVPEWQGKFVKDVEKEITQDLKDRGLLFDVVEYEHEYPFCWRCATPLLYYAKPSWFVRMSNLREQLLANNRAINWYPEHIQEGRFGEWLKEAKDWAFSRERYWGTPLPIWTCQPSSVIQAETGIQKEKQKIKDCKNIKVIGSIEELEKLNGKKIEDPHKPFIDEIEFPCEKCGSVMHRTPEVADVWFDSGAMPFGQSHFPFAQAREKGLDPLSLSDEHFHALLKTIEFPADYISEAVDQTRGWFYTLLAVATALGLESPYKNAICLGHLLDKEGKKMSKSKGNVIDPWEMIKKYGADSLRWYMFTVTQPGDAKRFDEQGLRETTRLFMTLLNVVTFYKTFAGNLEIECLEEKELTDVLDIWVVNMFNKLLQEVATGLDQYDITSAARKIGEFITELSTWYIRRSRDRFKSDDLNVKMPVLKTLRYIIFNLSKILAPFTPFIAEYVYSDQMKGDMSVHLKEWPEPLIKPVDENILQNMGQVRKISSLILEQRELAKIAVRQPLATARISNNEFRITKELTQLIKDETNIKAIEFIPGKGELTVKLDTTMSEELETEGLVREITRGMNALRKKEGLTINDIVDVVYSTDDTLAKIIEAQKETLAAKTLSRNWKPGEQEGMMEMKAKKHILNIYFEI